MKLGVVIFCTLLTLIVEPWAMFLDTSSKLCIFLTFLGLVSAVTAVALAVTLKPKDFGK